MNRDFLYIQRFILFVLISNLLLLCSATTDFKADDYKQVSQQIAKISLFLDNNETELVSSKHNDPKNSMKELKLSYLKRPLVDDQSTKSDFSNINMYQNIEESTINEPNTDTNKKAVSLLNIKPWSVSNNIYLSGVLQLDKSLEDWKVHSNALKLTNYLTAEQTINIFSQPKPQNQLEKPNWTGKPQYLIKNTVGYDELQTDHNERSMIYDDNEVYSFVSTLDPEEKSFLTNKNKIKPILMNELVGDQTIRNRDFRYMGKMFSGENILNNELNSVDKIEFANEDDIEEVKLIYNKDSQKYPKQKKNKKNRSLRSEKNNRKSKKSSKSLKNGHRLVKDLKKNKNEVLTPKISLDDKIYSEIEEIDLTPLNPPDYTNLRSIDSNEYKNTVSKLHKRHNANQILTSSNHLKKSKGYNFFIQDHSLDKSENRTSDTNYFIIEQNLNKTTLPVRKNPLIVNSWKNKMKKNRYNLYSQSDKSHNAKQNQKLDQQYSEFNMEDDTNILDKSIELNNEIVINYVGDIQNKSKEIYRIAEFNSIPISNLPKRR